ncbi:hypothetical protein [Lactococcus petauri]|uniref:hypothetical protein n=1 Tax=Lactococcus petauri TaxID=1940789 RepID=UPI0022DEAEF4|nr:hypothetical protein [Lactococcus petauri]
MIREVDEAKSMEKDAKIRQVFASLKLEHQDLSNKIFVEDRTRVSVAEEEVISETAICKRLATIRKIFEKEFKNFLGYTKDKEGGLVIEAEVIKRIFREYLEGSSLLDILGD